MEISTSEYEDKTKSCFEKMVSTYTDSSCSFSIRSSGWILFKAHEKKKVIQSAVISGSIQIPYSIIHSQIWSICNLLKGLFHLLDLSTLLTGCLSVSLNTSMFFTVAVGRSIQISIALRPTLVLVSDWYWHSRIGTLLLTSSKFSM